MNAAAYLLATGQAGATALECGAERLNYGELRAAIYQELIGFVPPRIEARLNVTGALDPQMLDLQERIRAHGMYPKCFDVKTAQLMLFGMLLMDLSDAAALHALQGLVADGAKLAGEQFGGYAQSSGSGNANIAVWRH